MTIFEKIFIANLALSVLLLLLGIGLAREVHQDFQKPPKQTNKNTNHPPLNP